MNDDDDDRTIVARTPALDDDPTTITRAPARDDDATRITRASNVDDDPTTITRAPVDDEATTISRGAAPSDLDDRTVVSGGRADLDDRTVVRGAAAEVDDRTAISPGRPDPLDDRTQIRGAARPGVDNEHNGPRASAPAPGRLSGGRVAFVPGATVERYEVRASAPVIDNVVRTVIPAPASPTRQSRNTTAIESTEQRERSGRRIGVIVAIAAVTFGALAVVAGIVIVLFVL